jgi:hypothetical protein
MIDVDPFLTTLYVMVDDFCQLRHVHEKHSPGPTASLQCSEVVTLALCGPRVAQRDIPFKDCTPTPLQNTILYGIFLVGCIAR